MPFSPTLNFTLATIIFFTCETNGKVASQKDLLPAYSSVKNLTWIEIFRQTENYSEISQRRSTVLPKRKMFPLHLLVPKVAKNSLLMASPNIGHVEFTDVEARNTTHPTHPTQHDMNKNKRSTKVYVQPVQHAKEPNEKGKHEGNEKENQQGNVKGNEMADIRLIGWKWQDVGVFITFAIFVFTVGYAKVAFHHTHFLEAYLPESFLMLALGAAVGFILYVLGYRMPLDLDTEKAAPSAPTGYQFYHYKNQAQQSTTETPESPESTDDEFSFPHFSPKLYFLILIPPIILEQSYALYDSEFSESLYPILLFSILGKLISTSSIGLILHALSYYKAMPPLPSKGNDQQWLHLTDSLVFASIISAVDPVPVLGLLHEAGVNKHLYFLIFGESLLNDAVSVSLYSSMVAFTGPVKVLESQYGMAVLAFIIKSLGGLLIGVIFGLISALAARTTEHHRTVEPLTLLGLAYISYLVAEVIQFSGHICLICCGLLQAHYAFQNISFTSYNSIIHFIKMLSSTSDAIILMFLGMAMINYSHVWHTSFILWTLLLCFVCRFFGVYILAMFHNLTSSRWINFRDQTILAYCGLRGALCLCLAHMLNDSRVPQKSLFVTTTLVVILFTTLVQGGTAQLLLRCLCIKRQNDESETLNEGIANSVFSLALCGIESITETKGNGYIKRTLEKFEETYLKKIFLSRNADHELQRMFQRLVLEGHISSRVPSGKVKSRYETKVLRGKPDGKLRFYPNTKPWEQLRRIDQHRPFRVERRKNKKIKEEQHNFKIMHEHFDEIHHRGPILIELHDAIPPSDLNQGRKLYLARVRKTSAEERLREKITEHLQNIEIPLVREAFVEN
ncbi:sodium/hydrogen exchanger 4-like [Neocloeon triangulifer]|uniref:sodium/hydrogen exchanger 4-like n=1 Tax=Neocloeon triangulifer TaxID=2078957 RepID=UPI00286F3D6F|nr:sodium/hydrogen exchanger 4-like [Neocloeon triangulifer]